MRRIVGVCMVAVLLITGDGSWNKRAIKTRGKDELAEVLNFEDER